MNLINLKYVLLICMISGIVMKRTTFEKNVNVMWRKDLNKGIVQAWHGHIHKVIQVMLENIYSHYYLYYTTEVLFIEMKVSYNFISYSREILKHTPRTSDIVKASGRLSLHANEMLMDTYLVIGGWFLNYTWNFYIHPHLALNITVENIQFASDYLECYWARLTVHNSKSLKNQFIYCGHQTNFNIYPSYNVIDISIHSYKHSSFAFTALQTIITERLIVSFETSNSSVPDISWVHLIKSEILVETFHIKVRKIHHLVVQFSETGSYTYELYDGPGFLSTNLRNSAHVYKTSTFQCVAQIATYIELVAEEERFFNYASKSLKISRIFNISSNKTGVTITLPMSLCTPNHCAIFLYADKTYHVTITVLEIIYKGPTGERCKYGGLVTGEETLMDYKESLTVCEKQHGLTFFSQNSSLILFGYWYEHYSKIQTTVHVSLTKCTAVQLDACTVQKLCHTFFNLNNLTICNLYLKHISQNHLSYYKNFDDFTDFVLFSLQDGNCMVIQLRKRTVRLDYLFYPQCGIQLRSSNVSQLGREVQYKLKGSFYSPIYHFKKLKAKVKIYKDYVAFYGDTLNFCFRRFKGGKFSCKFIERQKSREHPLVAAIRKRDYFHLISRYHIENKDFSVRARQSSSSESGLLRILIQLNLFSVSWMDIHISRHEVNRKVGSTFRDMYFTESILLPFISYDVQRIGYRWDHFVLLKLNVNSTTFERLSFKVKLKSRFDGQGNLTQLNWSSGFSLSYLRDSKVISLPGRIYEAALFLNTETTKLKNNSLNLFWLHENINDDSHVSSYLNGRDCRKTKPIIPKTFDLSACFNNSLHSLTEFEKCSLDALLDFHKPSHRITCLQYTFPKENSLHYATHYMIFSHEFDYMNLQFNIELYKLSWMEASNLCKDAGAMLPYFTSRQDLDQLIRLLKLSRDGFLLEGLFIGLVYSPTNEKVSCPSALQDYVIDTVIDRKMVYKALCG